VSSTLTTTTKGSQEPNYFPPPPFFWVSAVYLSALIFQKQKKDGFAVSQKKFQKMGKST
jgi:hypothetical protein